jgi:hypothetical protein
MGRREYAIAYDLALFSDFAVVSMLLKGHGAEPSQGSVAVLWVRPEVDGRLPK